MKYLNYLFCFVIFIFFQCKKEYENIFIKTIYIDTKNINQDKLCYEINTPFKFDRNIRIVKNTLADTILLAGVIPPKFIGNIYYSDYINEQGETVQLDKRYQNPNIEKICFSKYKESDSKGELTIEFLRK